MVILHIFQQGSVPLIRGLAIMGDDQKSFGPSERGKGARDGNLLRHKKCVTYQIFITFVLIREASLFMGWGRGKTETAI